MTDLPAPEVRFKASVRWRARRGDIVLVDTQSVAPALRLSLTCEPLLRSIEAGSLAAQATASQAAFVDRLRRQGLLEGTQLQAEAARQITQGSWMFAAPNRLAAWLAAPLRSMPPRTFAAALGLAAVVAAGFVALQIAAWLQGAPLALSPWGLLAYVALALPLHELSHTVACHWAGVPANAAGLRFRGRLLPGPFISTNNLALIPSPKRRAAVALAGPAFDLCFAAVALLGAHALSDHHTANAALSTAAITSLYLMFFNLNPFRHADGANALHELYEDENGVRRAGYLRMQLRCRRAYALVAAVLCALMVFAACQWLWQRSAWRWFAPSGTVATHQSSKDRSAPWGSPARARTGLFLNAGR